MVPILLLFISAKSFELGDHDPVVYGNNTCYMATAYYPTSDLEDILPKYMSIPDADIMREKYPDMAAIEGHHPFMMSFCHGENIHDKFTKVNVPQQNELMFVFPVIYNKGDGAHLCSYVPVLYLDSWVGVIGGLYFGLRKEYHPEMVTVVTDTSKDWVVKDIIYGNFTQGQYDEESLPHFVTQSFANPFVTVAYPSEGAKTYFYQAFVYPMVTKTAEGKFDWEYQGSSIKNNDESQSVYSEYWFAMSTPQDYDKYFAISAYGYQAA